MKPCHPLRLRFLYVALNVYQVMLVGGVFFGWPSLAEMLKRDGVFADRCDGPAPCQEQDIALSSVYSIGVLPVYLLSLPVGFFANALGPKRAGIIGACLSGCGAILLALSAVDVRILSLAVVVTSSAAPFCLLCSFHVASLFPAQHGLIIGLLSGGFDVAALTYRVLLALYASGVSRRDVFLAYAVVGPGLLFLASAVFHPWRPFRGVDAEVAEFESRSKAQVVPVSKTAAGSDEATPTGGITEGMDGIAESKGGEVGGEAGDAGVGDTCQSEGGSPTDGGTDLKAAIRADVLGLLADVRRPVYPSYFAYFIVVFTLFNFVLASRGAHMSSLGDDSGHYVGIFGILLPCGVVATPLSGTIADRMGPLAPLLVLSGLATVLSVLYAVPDFAAQIAAFALTGIFRGFLFAANANFLSSTFSLQRVSAHVGLIMFIAGIFVLVTIDPLVALATRTLGNDFTFVFAGFAALSALTIAFPLLGSRLSCLQPHSAKRAVAPSHAGGAQSDEATAPSGGAVTGEGGESP